METEPEDESDWTYTASNNIMYHGGYTDWGKDLSKYTANTLQKGVQTTVDEIRSLLDEKED